MVLKATALQAPAYSSFNEAYMAGLMTAPMVLIEIVVMRGMYKNTKLNAIIGAASVIAGLAFFLFIRGQTAVSDTQFLRSMIPHHAGAILMCENATITDPQTKKLCRTIIAGQQAEIDQMKQRLKELDAR